VSSLGIILYEAENLDSLRDKATVQSAAMTTAKKSDTSSPTSENRTSRTL
jgi:hypothetical protein